MSDEISKKSDEISKKIKKLKEKKKKGYLRKISDLIFDYMEYDKDFKRSTKFAGNYLGLKYDSIESLVEKVNYRLGVACAELCDSINFFTKTKQKLESYEYFLNLSEDDLKDESKFKDIFYNVCYRCNHLDEYEKTKLEQKFINKDFIKVFLANLSEHEYKELIKEVESAR